MSKALTEVLYEYRPLEGVTVPASCTHYKLAVNSLTGVIYYKGADKKWHASGLDLTALTALLALKADLDPDTLIVVENQLPPKEELDPLYFYGLGTALSPYRIILKITTDQRDSLTPHIGLPIYNTDESKFQYYNGADWVDLGSNYIFQQGITETLGTVRNDLITGKAGGQTIMGGTGLTDALTIQSTNNYSNGGSDIIFRTGNGNREVIRFRHNGSLLLDQVNRIYTLGDASWENILLNNTYNMSGSASGVVRGILYTPILTSLGNVRHIAIETTSGDVLLGGGKVLIGSTYGATPAASSIVDIQSTTKGILITRMTTTQRNAIPSPTVSLLIFNTTTNQFEFYDGTTWSALGSGTNALTKQTHTTTGTTFTVSNQTGNILAVINPPSLLATLTINLPSSPLDKQIVTIPFGGTITAGNDVVTSFTLSPVPLQASTPTLIRSGESISVIYDVDITKWRRI